MKTFGLYLLNLALLTMLVSCGKDNTSGTSSNFAYGNGYGSISSAYNYGGNSVNTVIAANPCMTGFAPNARATVQLPAPMGTVVQNGDIYVGVTSYGDVAVLVGNGTTNATFVAYICQRGAISGAQPFLTTMPEIGTTTKCLFKPLVSATLSFPGLPPQYNAAFRMMDFGNSQGAPFPGCMP